MFLRPNETGQVKSRLATQHSNQWPIVEVVVTAERETNMLPGPNLLGMGAATSDKKDLREEEGTATN